MEYEAEKREKNKKGRHTGWWILGIVVLFAVFVITVMAVNSLKPGRLELEEVDKGIKGAVFTRVNQELIRQMYENWLPNDMLWPTALLDNMPNFQLGELEVVRYNLRVLRDQLTRLRTTDKLDPLAESAFTAISNDPQKWWFPSAESKWKLAYRNLTNFYKGLHSGESSFFPRADNLVELLSQYASLMGGVNTRLINAPGDVERVLAIEDKENMAKGGKMVEVDIPWHRIDDNFYYAQGVAYALYESFKAIRMDFIEVLRDKNSVELVDKILEDLKRCYFEPLVVLNGDLESIFANHSLNLSGVFNDARQKVYSLIMALREG